MLSPRKQNDRAKRLPIGCVYSFPDLPHFLERFLECCLYLTITGHTGLLLDAAGGC